MASAIQGTALMIDEKGNAHGETKNEGGARKSLKLTQLMELFEHMFSSYLSLKGLMSEASISLEMSM
jgi:hypothetical protein